MRRAIYRSVVGAIGAAVTALSLYAGTANAVTPAMTSHPTVTRQAAGAATGPLQARIDQVMHAHPGGRQISTNSIAWDNGRVVLTLPSPGSSRAPADTAAILGAAPGTRSGSATPDLADTDWHGCPYANWFGGNHYYCFYSDINFGGSRVQFLYCGNVEDNLTNYGFNDVTSSWVNTKGLSLSPGYTINVYRDVNAAGGSLWQEPPATASSWVGSANNDQASSWTC